MNIKDFIKKRNEKLKRVFIEMLQCLYGGDSMEQEAEKIIQDFHSTSLRLFAEEIKKEIEKRKIPKPDCSCNQNQEVCDKCAGRYQREGINKTLSDLIKMLE